MAGASAPSLSIAVANAGGLGSCGVLLMQPEEILAWAREVRARSNGAFQLNIRSPTRRLNAILNMKHASVHFGAMGSTRAARSGRYEAAGFRCPMRGDAGGQPARHVIGDGAFPAGFRGEAQGARHYLVCQCIDRCRGTRAEAAGADVIVAQGAEAGGHRGCFDAAQAERQQVGLFALLPAVVDAVGVPVAATGGIADPRGAAAALALGASAVQIGTGFLRCPEAKIHPAWADALARTLPEDTVVSRAFSGRAGPSIATDMFSPRSPLMPLAGALSRPARPDRSNEDRGPEGGRCPSHAGLGGAVGCAGKSRAGGGSDAAHLGRRQGYSGVNSSVRESREQRRVTPTRWCPAASR